MSGKKTTDSYNEINRLHEEQVKKSLKYLEQENKRALGKNNKGRNTGAAMADVTATKLREGSDKLNCKEFPKITAFEELAVFLLMLGLYTAMFAGHVF